MRVEKGDIVQLRDGRVVYVTDVTDENPEIFSFENEGGTTIHKFSPENILIGELVYLKGTAQPIRVVTDMSEVVAIIEE